MQRIFILTDIHVLHIFLDKNLETYDISLAFIAKLATLKTVQFFGPSCIIYT